jgi:hypothetical protein
MQRAARAAQIAALIIAMGNTETPADAGEVVQHLTITATFRPQASLRVSSKFVTVVVDETGVGRESVDYVAAVRAPNTAEVLLSVECADVTAQVGAADQVSILIGGDERNATGIQPGAPTAVARWTGGGTRAGRLTFHLRAFPGTYVVPLRMSLATP